MYGHRVLLLLILFVGLGTLFFGVQASYKLYRYYTETTYTVAQSTEWSLQEYSRTRFIPKARYQYVIRDTSYTGETELTGQVYRNRWAAEEDLATYPQKVWKVWYDPSHPERSTLQKSFPFKATLSTALLICILGYLIWLSSYVKRTSS